MLPTTAGFKPALTRYWRSPRDGCAALGPLMGKGSRGKTKYCRANFSCSEHGKRAMCVSCLLFFLLALVRSFIRIIFFKGGKPLDVLPNLLFTEVTDPPPTHILAERDPSPPEICNTCCGHSAEAMYVSLKFKNQYQIFT